MRRKGLAGGGGLQTWGHPRPPVRCNPTPLSCGTRASEVLTLACSSTSQGPVPAPSHKAPRLGLRSGPWPWPSQTRWTPWVASSWSTRPCCCPAACWPATTELHGRRAPPLLPKARQPHCGHCQWLGGLAEGHRTPGPAWGPPSHAGTSCSLSGPSWAPAHPSTGRHQGPQGRLSLGPQCFPAHHGDGGRGGGGGGGAGRGAAARGRG